MKLSEAFQKAEERGHCYVVANKDGFQAFLTCNTTEAAKAAMTPSTVCWSNQFGGWQQVEIVPEDSRLGRRLATDGGL